MLHDPKRGANPFDINSLIFWLECQPPEQTYNYVSPCGCLLAQFFGAHGYERPYLTRDTVNEFIRYDTQRALPVGFDRIARDKPHTFGAALDRARAFANA